MLTFVCNKLRPAEDFWELFPVFPSLKSTTSSAQKSVIKTERSIFTPVNGFGIFAFNQEVLPNFLSSYSSSVILFYGAIVYVIASAFRSAFVPLTWEVFIINAPFTEDILKICQCIHIYRVKR